MKYLRIFQVSPGKKKRQFLRLTKLLENIFLYIAVKIYDDAAAYSKRST